MDHPTIVCARVRPRSVLAARHRRRLLGALLALACIGWAPLAPAPAGAAPSPASYRVSALCSSPSRGHAGCLGLRLAAKEPSIVPGTVLAPGASRGDAGPVGPDTTVEHKKPWPESLTPANLLTAYGLGGLVPPSTQTIGLVDAYDDPTMEADLAHFDSQYGLPACTEANGCLRKVNQSGEASPLPPSSGELERGWAQEIATDVEVAHGVCQSCHILLVEANSNLDSDLFAAERTAVALGATEISNSWGGEEPEGENPAFEHPGIVITASAGDDGYLNWFSEEEAAATANYPASSPHVVAVGGTRLELNEPSRTWRGETVWNDGGETEGFLEGAGAGGGGCSEVFAAPPWQQALPNWSAVGCGSSRAVADVAADADPYTGVSVYDSTPVTEEGKELKGWWMIGGTSVASPIVAATFALAGGAQGVEYPARTLYENAARTPSSLHDVTSGSNGECLEPFNEKTGESGCSTGEEAASCSAHAICLAGPGYDGPTGVGTPNGIAAFLATGVGAPKLPSNAQSPAPPVTSSPGNTSAAPLVPLVSGLGLTHRAIAALNRHRPRISKVGFAFTLNMRASVRVLVALRVRVHGHIRWETISKLTIVANAGRQARQLPGRAKLLEGRYRLTLAPLGGLARSIYFQIG